MRGTPHSQSRVPCERDGKPESVRISGLGSRDPSVCPDPSGLSHQEGLEQRLANAKKKASQMEEQLPAQALSEDQRRRLLCRAHELEVENTGPQASSLCRRSLSMPEGLR